MLNRSKLMLAALTAALILGALVSAASATRIAMSNQNFRATWNPMVFHGGAFGTVSCQVTIEGSFHSRTISKVLEALVGYVTRAIVNEAACTGGRARALTETLPWHIRYAGFEGTLPRIRKIILHIVGGSFNVNVAGIQCTFTSTAARPMSGAVVTNETSGVAENIEIDNTAQIPSPTGGFCPSEGTLENRTATLTLLGATTKITVTLVA